MKLNDASGFGHSLERAPLHTILGHSPQRAGATSDDGPSTCSHVATASALHTSIETGRTTCDLCGRQGHTLERCFKLTRAPVGERQNILKRVGACFRCLSTAKGHIYI